MKKVETIYFVEGECEMSFVNSFKANRDIISGKVRKVNFWEVANINRIIRSLPKGKSNIFVVFDTDVTSEMTRFSENIKALSKYSRKLVLLPQYKHFEDEIAFACSQPAAKDLPEYLYRCQTMKVFKQKFSQDKNLVNNLSSKGFELPIMWSRPEIAEQQLDLKMKNLFWGIDHVVSS